MGSSAKPEGLQISVGPQEMNMNSSANNTTKLFTNTAGSRWQTGTSDAD
jgi:hypothetical protein